MIMRLRELFRRRLFVVILIFLLILVAALALNDFIQENIAPGLLAWMWSVYIMSSGFPQVMTWAFFVSIIPVVAIFSLIRAQPLIEEEESAWEQQKAGQVQALAKLMQQAAQGAYFKQRINHYLANLALDTLQYQERLSADEVKASLKRGELPMETELQEYMRAGWRKHRLGASEQTGDNHRWSQLRSGPQHRVWNDPQTEKVVQYLESLLEVERES